MATSSLLDSRKIKTVETDSFKLEGHLLKWKEVMIQLDNVSMVTASELPASSLPVPCIVLLAAGIVLTMIGYDSYHGEFTSVGSVGLIVLISSIAWAGIWIYNSMQTSNYKYLNFLLNSGYTYSILFKNPDFLASVVATLDEVFTKDLDENTRYYFNIRDCVIRGGAILNRGKINNR